MRRTVALFILAMSIFVLAVALHLRGASAPAEHQGPEGAAWFADTPVQADQPPAPLTPQPTPSDQTSSIARLTLGKQVELQAQLGGGLFKAGSEGPLTLLMDLEARSDPRAGRPPLAIALVIDRSGSMAGEKMLRAKEAARALLERLHDCDQLALISYASDFTEDVPLVRVKGQRARIQRAIDGLLDGGGTNLSGGLSAAVNSLRQESSQIPQSARRVVLLSDGNANQGTTDPRRIALLAEKARHEGITVSTVGLGLDFNEDLMTVIAQAAGGGYYYVRNAGGLVQVLNAEFQGLAKLAARGVEVGLEGLEGLEAVTVRKVYGYRTERRAGRLVIPVGDMRTGERRRIMVELAVPPVAEGEVARLPITLLYTDGSGVVGGEYHGELRAIASLDARAIEASAARDVEAAFAEALAGEARQEAAATFESGRGSEAVEHLRRQLDSTRRKQANLGSPALHRQLEELERTIDDLSKFDARSDEGRDLVKREKLRARQIFAY